MICHEVILARVVKDIRFQGKLLGVKRPDAEEFRNHQVGGQCLPYAPENRRCVIQSLAGRSHFCLRICVQEGSLVENEGGKLKVRFFQGPLSIHVWY